MIRLLPSVRGQRFHLAKVAAGFAALTLLL
jgi:hypothetical protein